LLIRKKMETNSNPWIGKDSDQDEYVKHLLKPNKNLFELLTEQQGGLDINRFLGNNFDEVLKFVTTDYGEKPNPAHPLPPNPPPPKKVQRNPNITEIFHQSTLQKND
jgi:hypothetical protein